jgi:hypothetical protein
MPHRTAAEWLPPILISTLAIFAPIHTVIASMFLLVFVDSGLGMWAARTRGEDLTSKGMSRTGKKLLFYVGTCLVIYAMECWLIGPVIPLLFEVPALGSMLKALDPYPLTKMAGGWFLLTEMVSLAENADTILGREVFGGIARRVAPVKLLGLLIKRITGGKDEAEKPPTGNEGP